jgi:PAS domain S-box-containing protein
VINWRITTLSAGFGLALWILDAALDALFFYQRPFLSLLLTGVPPHELYIRTIILGSFLLFGVIASWQAARLEARDRDVSLFRTLLDEATDSIFVIDPDSGAFIDVNDTACDTLGYDRSSLLDMGVTDINPRFDDSADFREFTETDGQILDTYETTHVRADGTTIPIEISASDVALDDRIYRIAIARDITDRKERQQEIRASQERFESLFNSIRDAIVVADADRRIVECNPAFTDLFGYSRGEIEGKPTTLLYESDAEFEALGDALEVHKNDSQFTQTITYETKSGHTFPGETNISYLRDADDNLTGFIGVIRDVSDLREQLRQIKMIDTVLRHNLHNDMNVILGHADEIREVGSEDVVRSAERIHETGTGLVETMDKERIVTDFLANQPSIVRVDAVRLVTTAVEEIRDRYPDADISVTVPDEQSMLAVTQIRKAIVELVENAIAHSDREVPAVTVALAADDGTVEIRIADDGPGIPEMERRVLIEGEEIQPLYHGSGFGLWLVSVLVQHSDGTLSVTENDPRGTVVTIRLPAA